MLMGRLFLFALAPIILVAAGATAQRSPSGWQLPDGAEREVNPVPASEKVIERGRAIYQSRCRRCHGPLGKGDGPEADPERRPADLSDPRRAARNPDGIVFYKVWNGRRNPDMPAFKTEMEREDVWAVVHYVKQLREQAK